MNQFTVQKQNKFQITQQFNLVHLLMTIAVAYLLAGCAGPTKDLALKSEIYNAGNAGLIVGSIVNGGSLGTGISFKSIATGVKQKYIGATDFSMWLPPGEYELEGVGSRAGSLGAFKKPLTFLVEKGRISYIGTISYGCNPKSSVGAWYGLQKCGFLALSDKCTVAEPQIPMCVIDEQKETVNAFLTKNPEFATIPVVSATMK